MGDGGDVLGQPDFSAAVLEVVQDGLAVLDGTGRARYLNPSARRLLGIPDGADLLLWRYAPELFLPLQNLQLARHQVFEARIAYPERRLLRVTCLPLSQQFLWALVLHDATEEERRREEAVEDGTGAVLRVLLGSLAHELGNPLNTIRIQLQLLRRKWEPRRGSGRDVASLAICEGEVDRMHSLLTHFLDALRPAKPTWQDVDLARLVRHTVAVRSGELERVRLKLDLPAEPVCILGDGELLHRALSHLLRNALEALESGGTIAIRLRCDATAALLEVEDSGVGIPESAIPHLFQPQYSTKEQGNGLGLIAVQQTIRAHRGTVAIRALEAGGTCVILRLPLKNPRFPALGHFRPCALCDGSVPAEAPHFPSADGSIVGDGEAADPRSA
ncbi:MAG: hypothetical protein LBT98_01560 [Puniceicoccales bacterium]|jgi:signal transduction histidine kinase|nr:hypothetical protein [Puniceicoccales bacterium]